jgi:hypothetical protein
MAIKTFTTGEVLTASDTNTYLANSGLVYVTSVTAGAGSSTLVIDNCFSSTYTNYVIVFNISGYAVGPLYMQLRTGSGNDTAATYAYARNYFRWDGGASGGDSTMTGTTFTVGYCGGGSVTTIENEFNLYNPNVADRTSMGTTLVEIGTATTNSYNMIANGQKQNTTQYTGFSLIRYSTNTFAGTATVYGYRKG